MKTILMTIFSPFAARNILRPGFLDLLFSQTNCRLILIVPETKQEFYRQQFASQQNIIIEGIKSWRNPDGWLDRIFLSLSLHYVETETVKILRRTWGKKFRPLFKVFKYLPVLRQLCRWLDWHLVVDKRPDSYLERYRPDLVIAAHAIYFEEQAFIREAKRRQIKTVSIINSWDNLTVYKGVIRVLPDQLIVPNEIVQREALDFCDLPASRVPIIGMWSCDHYFKSKPASRQTFCRALGLDPGKPFIIFASIGHDYSDTEWEDIELIQKAIVTGQLPTDLQILIRSHPNPRSPFASGQLTPAANIFYQSSSTPLTTGEQDYEITPADDQAALDAIYHSAVVVTIQSTISLETAALDRPVININFDGWEKRGSDHPLSVKRYHHFTHYLPVHQSGGVYLAHSPEQLITGLARYLKQPQTDQAARQRLAKRLCWRLDGDASKRLAKLIVAEL